MSNPIQPVNDATSLLGHVHTTQQNRDAVHVACIQVELAETWNLNGPATMLTINKEGKAVPTEHREKALGILDPFIQNCYDLNDGDKVWLILFPGMIRSLSHYWEHEAFPPAPAEKSFAEFKAEQIAVVESAIPSNKLESHRYLTNIADHLDLSLDELLTEAHNKVAYVHHYYTGGSEAEGYSVGKEFWKHYQNYTGTTVPEDNQNNFISCSC